MSPHVVVWAVAGFTGLLFAALVIVEVYRDYLRHHRPIPHHLPPAGLWVDFPGFGSPVFVVSHDRLARTVTVSNIALIQHTGRITASLSWDNWPADAVVMQPQPYQPSSPADDTATTSNSTPEP